MNGTTDARSAMQDLLQFHFGRFHFGRNTWLPLLLATVVVGALVIHLSGIMSSLPRGAGYLYAPGPRKGLVYSAVICWAVATVGAYAGGFVMGRLYVPRSTSEP
jgi:hypothetical protein